MAVHERLGNGPSQSEKEKKEDWFVIYGLGFEIAS